MPDRTFEAERVVVRGAYRAFAIATSCFFIVSCVAPAIAPAHAVLHDDALAAAVTDARYAIRRVDSAPAADGEPAYEASNHAESFRASFTRSGVRLRSNGDRPWQARVELQGYGYDDDLLGLTTGAIQAQANRIEIRKHAVGGTRPSELIEWYVNTPKGLEQGFTLAGPPALDPRGAPNAHRRLRLVMKLTGDLHAALTDAGRAIELQDAQGRHVVVCPPPRVGRDGAGSAGPDARQRARDRARHR